MTEIALATSDLQISAARRRKEAAVRVALLLAATLSVVITLLIVVSLVGEALAFVTGEDFTWASLREIGWFPRRGFYDIGTLIVGWGAGWAIFSAIDIPGIYQLDGNGPLSQAIFGLALIAVVFFAPQGLIGAIRQARSKFVQIVPVAPTLPEGIEILVNDVDELTSEIEAAKK